MIKDIYENKSGDYTLNVLYTQIKASLENEGKAEKEKSDNEFLNKLKDPQSITAYTKATSEALTTFSEEVKNAFYMQPDEFEKKSEYKKRISSKVDQAIDQLKNKGIANDQLFLMDSSCIKDDDIFFFSYNSDTEKVYLRLKPNLDFYNGDHAMIELAGINFFGTTVKAVINKNSYLTVPFSIDQAKKLKSEIGTLYAKYKIPAKMKISYVVLFQFCKRENFSTSNNYYLTIIGAVFTVGK